MSTKKFTRTFNEAELISYNEDISAAIIQEGEEVEGLAVSSALFGCFALLPFPEVKIIATVLSCGLAIATNLKDALFDKAILCSRTLETAEDLIHQNFDLAELEIECDVKEYEGNQYFFPLKVSLLRLRSDSGNWVTINN